LVEKRIEVTLQFVGAQTFAPLQIVLGENMNKMDYIEFWTNDTKKLGEFLTAAFGYQMHPSKDDGYTHWQIPGDDSSVGGIHFTDKPATGTRTMAYVAVDDIAAMVKKVESCGARIVYGPEEVDKKLYIVNMIAPEGTPIGMWSHKE